MVQTTHWWRCLGETVTRLFNTILRSGEVCWYRVVCRGMRLMMNIKEGQRIREQQCGGWCTKCVTTAVRCGVGVTDEGWEFGDRQDSLWMRTLGE